ncbi:MAG: class I SAM-dependent methyltransferase [Phototrophicaceae bacterium]
MSLPMTVQQLIEMISDPAQFVSATFSGKRKGDTSTWKKAIVRPIELKGQYHLQFSWFDDKKNIVKNYRDAEQVAQLHALFALPFRHLHLLTLTEAITVNLSNTQHVAVSRKSLDAPVQLHLQHDRQKTSLLDDDRARPFLIGSGIMTQDGHIRADKKRKHQQISEFLRLLSETDRLIRWEGECLRVVDFGCGSAQLTFGMYYYFQAIRQIPVEIVGVDLKEDLMLKVNRTARDLAYSHLTFVSGRIDTYQQEMAPHVVTALHACDTATDDAIVRAIRWGSAFVFVAPCCHHHLQAQLDQQPTPVVFKPIVRYGLFQERMGDMLTDSFRALILRIMGYQVDVIEFVAPDHTPKNVLIRAVRTQTEPDLSALKEYQALLQYWLVKPYLHTQLADLLDPLLNATVEDEPHRTMRQD